MTRRTQLLTLALSLAMAGCAALSPDRPADRDARIRLDRGIAALEAGHYTEAFDELVWVYGHCPGREAASRARLALAALELDPRNPRARPDVGTRLLGEAIRDPGVRHWTRPLTETAFLSALALGAPHPDSTAATAHDHGDDPDDDRWDEPGHGTPEAHGSSAGVAATAAAGDEEPTYGCGDLVAREGWTPPGLPELPGPSMATLLADAQTVRDSVSARADTLTSQLAAVREQLRVTREELERIRETLKP